MTSSVIQEVVEEMERLGPAEQQQMLEYVRSLAAVPVRGMPGRAMLRFAGSIPAADLDEIEAAIEEGCERVDPHAW